MRRILSVFVCFALLGSSVLAQSGNSQRPRVVTNPTPPTIQDGSINQNQTKRPPVLTGGSNSQTQPQTSATPPPDETPIEEDDEVIRVETNLVTMPVSVLDRDGRFISGLQQRDFQIFENGVQQKIEYFASVEQPFTVILMIDVSPSTQYRIDEIQDAAISFVDQLRPDDKVKVISFDEQIHVLSPVTNNRNVLRNAIRRADFGDGTSLYDAVEYVLRDEIKQIEGRKAVVLFTDGVDTTSRRAIYQTNINDAQETEALFYPIRYDTYQGGSYGGGGGGGNYPPQRRGGGNGGGTLGGIIGIILGGGNVQIGRGGGGGGSMGSSREEYERGKRYLEELARNSGGRNFEAQNNLTAAFSGIAEELRRQYSVGYYPEKAGQKGERRQIKVRVMRPNLVVRAKNSYVVGANSSKFAGR